jgi:uncharacterized protein
MGEYSERLIQWISREPEMMRLLQMVQTLKLPQGCISAGFVRNFVWDTLHEYGERTALHDIDVIYFDRENTDTDQDAGIEHQLKALDPHVHWQVRNQARMHLRNGHAPYKSIEDAMKYWPETATAVGVRLGEEGILEISAPHGLFDLYHLVLRQSPFCNIPELFYKRIDDKQWLVQWPKLKVLQGGTIK